MPSATFPRIKSARHFVVDALDLLHRVRHMGNLIYRWHLLHGRRRFSAMRWLSILRSWLRRVPPPEVPLHELYDYRQFVGWCSLEQI